MGPTKPKSRSARVERNTKETKIAVEVNLDGEGRAEVATGVPFLDHMLVLFTHQPALFARCPWVDHVYAITDDGARSRYAEVLTLFDTGKLPYHLMDTFDFMSIPAGLGQLSFREKQLEYFPAEADTAERFASAMHALWDAA